MVDLSLLANVPVPEGHDITGALDPEAGLASLSCSCSWSAVVDYGDNIVLSMSALADHGRDHLLDILGWQDSKR